MSPDTILVLASCTKLLTSLAALRLVQDGTLALDDPALVEKHLPELCVLPVLTNQPGEDLKLVPRDGPITLRQLLTHSSGATYDVLDPRLIDWRAQRGEQPFAFAGSLPHAIETPSVFQPGAGWAYGAGLDWVGMLIERVSGQTLGAFLRTHVLDVVGCDARVGFERAALADGDAVVQTVTNWEDGSLVDYPWPPAPQKSHRGGGGLLCSAANFARVLADLIAPEPRILSPQTLDLLFSPQFDADSKPLAALRHAAPVFTSMTGALTGTLPAEAINHALGGLLITEDNGALGRTAGTMAWGGAFNCLWFANREAGVAGFYGSSMFPPGESNSSELMGSFVRDLWAKAGARA